MARLISHLKPWFFVSSLTKTGAALKTQVITRTATGGTATMTVNGETTAATAFTASTTAANVKAALLALLSIDVGDVDVTGSTGGPFTIVGDIADITVDDASATGGTVTIADGVEADPGDIDIVPIASLTDDANITEGIRAFAGWSFGSTDVDVPDLSSKFPKTIPGLYDKSTPSLDIYRNGDPASRDAEIEDLLVEGATGFIVRVMDVETPIVGSKVQVWPVTVKSAVANGDSEATSGAPQLTKVMFSVTDAPQLAVTVSA